MIVFGTGSVKGTVRSFTATGSIDCDRLKTALEFARDNMPRGSDVKEWLHKVVRYINGSPADKTVRVETWNLEK